MTVELVKLIPLLSRFQFKITQEAVFIQEADESQLHTTNPDNTQDGKPEGAVSATANIQIDSERDDSV